MVQQFGWGIAIALNSPQLCTFSQKVKTKEKHHFNHQQINGVVATERPTL